jgi:hypothetical protein
MNGNVCRKSTTVRRRNAWVMLRLNKSCHTHPRTFKMHALCTHWALSNSKYVIVLWPAKTQWKMNRIGKHGWLQGAECRHSRFFPSLFADLADFTDRMQKRCHARVALRWGQFVQNQATSSQTAPVILKSNVEELCSAYKWESKKRASLYYLFRYEFRDASLKLASTTGYNITTFQLFSWIPGESNEDLDIIFETSASPEK